MPPAASPPLRNSVPAARPDGWDGHFRIPIASERQLLGLVHGAGSITQADITRLMVLSQPTVSRLVSGLAADGLLVVGPSIAQGRGQPSAAVRLRADYAFGMGIALLGDSVSLHLIDFAGALRWRRTLAMPSMARALVLEALCVLKAEMLADTRIDPSRIFAAGVGISAFFVGEGALMNPPPLLDDWALIDIPAVLANALELPVVVDNDGNVACIGEALLGAGRHYRAFAYFQITNGFGGGIVLDGRTYRGSFGNAGEFAALWQAAGLIHPNLERLRVLLAGEGRSFASVSDMVADFDPGWPGVDAWLDEAAPAFSLAATAASAVIDCEAIVLGGRIPRELALRLAERITIAGTDRRERPRPLPVVIPAEVEGDAVSTGAAIFALQPTFFISHLVESGT
jgi:predicted NBD/HSP70 family sugar kinase